jgi:hypothetical protein
MVRLAGEDILRTKYGYVRAGHDPGPLPSELEARRAKNRERAARLRARRQAAGLCITCGKPAETPHTRCGECLAKMRRGRGLAGELLYRLACG